MTTGPDSTELRTVRVLQIPLGVQARTTQHFDELMREFALISLDADRVRSADDSARPVPHRLTDLVQELTENFSAFTADVEAERDAALARGDAEIDLTYQLPAAAADASRRLGELLDEADDYCRSGQHLITLATPPESLAFRQWYLEEFIGQIEAGRDPIPWRDHVAEHHQADAWAKG